MYCLTDTSERSHCYLEIEGTRTIMANGVSGHEFKSDNELQKGQSEYLLINLYVWLNGKTINLF